MPILKITQKPGDFTNLKKFYACNK